MSIAKSTSFGTSSKSNADCDRFAALIPGSQGEWSLELQTSFKPLAETLEFGKSNFGFLAVRVAKTLSAHFGDGQLTNSQGRLDESRIFGQRARWVDYSGSVTVDDAGKPVQEGITFIDHPTNAGYPHRWHVREDGWMGCSACFSGPLTTTKQNLTCLTPCIQI